MSINHPKQKQIRLPFSVPRPNHSEASSSRICGICRKRDSNYTCPRCNVAYCSLACFRDESHSQCSEPFYKSVVMSEISAEPGTGNEEKRKMMEMLKRFEEAQMEGEEALEQLRREEEHGDPDDEDELEAALRNINLDEVDSNELLRLLPPNHRDAFLAALRDPESEAAKGLLDAAVANDEESPKTLPWWERPAVTDDEDEGASGAYAFPPLLLEAGLMGSISPPSGIGLKLAFNVMAVCIAYLHTLLSFRMTCLDSAALEAAGMTVEEMKKEIAGLVGFLSDPKSTVRYGSVREAWTAVWEAIGQTMDAPPPNILLTRLLEILTTFLHPPLSSDEPTKATLALCHLYRLFAVPKPGSAAPRKLLFYIVATRQLNRPDWLALGKAVESEVNKLKAEQAAPELEGTDDRPALRIT